MKFKAFDIDWYFVARLRGHGLRVFDGVTDSVIRRERIRAAIIGARLANTSMDDDGETFAAAFARLYAMSLE